MDAKKSIKLVANVTGWYLIKAVCDEGLIVTNVKLEAGVPLELSFANELRRDEPRPEENRPFRDTKNFRKHNKYRGRR